MELNQKADKEVGENARYSENAYERQNEDARRFTRDSEDWPPRRLENQRNNHVKDSSIISHNSREPSTKLLNRSSEKTGSLYERTIQMMNHKKLFNRTLEAHKVNEMRHQKHSSHTKPGKYEDQVSSLGQKKYGNYIRKPRIDPHSELKASNLRSSIMRRILTEGTELEPMDESYERPSGMSRKQQDRNNSLSLASRDYSLEMYKRQIEGDDTNGRRRREPAERSGSRSFSQNMNRNALNISDEKINVGRLLNYYKEMGE